MLGMMLSVIFLCFSLEPGLFPDRWTHESTPSCSGVHFHFCFLFWVGLVVATREELVAARPSSVVSCCWADFLPGWVWASGGWGGGLGGGGFTSSRLPVKEAMPCRSWWQSGSLD